jgi:serine/threonine protein kinase
MGIVYGGTDLRLGREVAVKTLTRLSEEAAQRLLIEARAMADLAHPNIAVLYGAEIWRATPLLIMEYMAGGTLAAALQKKPMSPAAALPFMKALAAALVHVHRLNQYHGDIKPSNIGFTRDGVIKFLDFGLSRTIVVGPDEDHDRAAPAGAPGPVAGTWAYMSPEVREGAAPGPILDVWALTIVFFECVAGKHPFAGSSRWETSCDVPAALQLLTPELSPVFGDFFEHAFAPIPSRYPNSAATLLNELERLDAPAVR